MALGAHELRNRLEQLNRIGAALSSEKDIHRLTSAILAAAKSLVHSDGATLYLVREGGLHFEIALSDRLKLDARSGDLPVVPLSLPDGTPNDRHVVACAVNRDETVVIDDAYRAEGYDFSGTRAFDAAHGYRSQSFLCVPMKNHEGETIAALQLINALDDAGQVTVFDEDDVRLAQSLASQAAVALTNRELIESLETLFESFVKLINHAIDDKSPYTSAHCQRVPILTMMLAEAVHRTHSGPFTDFSMSEPDRYELKIAGLLHDCGKITTPVHVIDKSTKLQTLFDRIALLEARLVILQRDAELVWRRGECSEAEYQTQAVELSEALQFLHKVNAGGEAMSDADVARVEALAQRRWRDLDGAEHALLSEDERENLTIRKGTLTRAERAVINHHIEVTIEMLEQLPWPQHLARVPEFAGGHHERMDGRGYPKGLTRDEMSVQARIMGIADVFEALTARDRPYKPGMKLSTALGILARMAAEQHIDADLFAVFIRERVYEGYAVTFLEAEQIDEIDCSALLRQAGVA
ncbi:HD domain-containing phosphohydrolase [Chitinibacteraceae bacterium HSL-7]